jgi:hypothetical protein
MLGAVNLALGAALLVGGRRVFWLLVGSVGFLVGLQVATRLIHRSEVLVIVSALALGALFAMMAVFLETIAIGLASFLGGGYALLGIASLLGVGQGTASVALFVFGGVLGALLTVLLFDWALITISTLAGAAMVVGSLILLQPAARGPICVALVILGVLIQGVGLRRERSRARHPTVK